jgi:hypothetical protein
MAAAWASLDHLVQHELPVIGLVERRPALWYLHVATFRRIRLI